MKNSTNEMKTVLQFIGHRTEKMKERISELEDRNLEMIWVNKETELRFYIYIYKETLRGLADFIRKAKIRIMITLEEEGKK